MKNIILILLLSISACSILDAGQWDKSLNLSFGANHSNVRIHANNKLYDTSTTGLEFSLDSSLNGNMSLGTWKNSLEIDYAGSKIKDESNPWNDSHWVESSDELVLDSIFRFETNFFLHVYTSVNIQASIYDTNQYEERLAFRPLQLRDSIGLSLPIMDSENQDFTFRAGFFLQHYLNPVKETEQRSHGWEAVIEYEGNLAKNIVFESKAGVYTGLASTDDYGNPFTQSRKAVLEWDNKIVIQLNKLFTLNITYNMDNKDVSEEEIGYEVDHRTSLAINWKVF
jgi:hypothetical protein